MSVTWIEASAGTGKTFTLVQKVQELVVEHGLTVDRILLVTFTEKATAELKTRVRAGLRKAWKASGEPRLAQALEDLPSLTVATIHGFCRALLAQFPLESGVSFEMEMVDQGRQGRRQLREQLRSKLTDLEESLLLLAGLEDEEDLLALAGQALGRNLFALPLLHPDTTEQETFETYRQALSSRSGPLWEALDSAGSGVLPETLSEALEGAAGFLHATNHKIPYQTLRGLLAARTLSDLVPFLDEKALAQLERWGEGGNVWKKNLTGPLPPLLQRLKAAAENFLAAVEGLTPPLPTGLGLGEFLSGCARYRLLADLCRPVLSKRSDRELTFHDLIDRVRTLVTTPAGKALVAGASARWKAVLIDEFQDTDSEQWDIFSSLFFDADHDLVLVGDPKQSIYRFRGADLSLYRSVREQVTRAGAQTLVLDENYRSTEAMIQAVNTYFDPAGGTPWDHPEDFHPSRKGAKPIETLLRVENGVSAEVAPLALYQPTTEAAWHRHLVKTVLEFLSGPYVLDDGQTSRPLVPGDFLVLVRTNREAWRLYRLFSSSGIPATVGGSGGLLKGGEAKEILLFLKALESPRSLSAAGALTWTRLFAGASVEQLIPALDEAQQDRDQGKYLRAFRRVAAAVEPGVLDGGGLERVLAGADGARTVTNAEHVLELVQERHHQGLIPWGQAALSLETWIQSQLQEDEVDLRRDGEARTLRLLTVHAAKGLEAPIVLHGHGDSTVKEDKLCLVTQGADFLRTGASRQAEKENAEAERLRLRYVALTRAKTHQVLQDERATTPVPESSGSQGRALGVWKGGLLSTPLVPELGEAIEGLENRHPWVESHTALWRRATREEHELPTVWDRPRVAREDEGPRLEPPAPDPLPAGPAFGDLVHDLLEQADYRAWDPQAPKVLQKEVSRLVEGHCQRHRADFGGRDLTAPLGAWLASALNHSFDLGAQTPPVTFTRLAPEDTRRELEFHLPLTVKTARSFAWGDWAFTVHRGFLTGRIDLLFRWEGRLYLADWKTNRLDAGQNLNEVMSEAGYDLQAQWYWEALRRLAALQGDQQALGGVLFVFLRGNGTQPGGVFFNPEELGRVGTLRPLLAEAFRA